MKVFVTGASGFIGSYLTTELIQHGHTVVGLARSDASAKKIQDLGATSLKGDIFDHVALASGARDADAIVHCAFIHDFLDPNHSGRRNSEVDVKAVRAMAEAIRGTNKPIISMNGTFGAEPGVVLTEDTPKADDDYRKAPEDLSAELGRQGIRTVCVRLAPSVHGKGDVNFMPILIEAAKKNGYSQYVDDGETAWPVVNVLDVVKLFRYAVENQLPCGTMLHAIDSHVKAKDFTAMIGKKLGLPTKSVTLEEAKAQLGFIGFALGTDCPATKEKTVALTGWKCENIGLLVDLDKNYF